MPLNLPRSFIVSVAIGIAAGLGAANSEASAYTCAYSTCDTMGGQDCTPEVKDSSSYSTPVSNAVSSWNTASTYIGPNVSSSSTEVTVTSSAYGTAGAWSGVLGVTTHGLCCTMTASYAICSASIRLNTTYLGGYTNTKRQAVVAHELGHAWGLGHTGTANRLMYSSIAFYDTYGVYTPQADDKSGIAYINSALCSGV